MCTLSYGWYLGWTQGSFIAWLKEVAGIYPRTERGFFVDNTKSTFIKLAVAASVGALYRVLRHYEVSQMLSVLCCIAVIVAMYFWSRRSFNNDLDPQDEQV